jgi:ribose transport system ATP-binding protein
LTGAAAAELPTLSLRRLSKTFDGRTVLRDASVDVWPGTVHGLIGQNGSGKSTLIKILASYHAPDPGGELAWRGEPVPLPLSPVDPARLGMTFVHQDLGLIETATVTENVRVGAYQTSFPWNVSWRRERRIVADALERFDVRVDPEAPIATLRPVDKAQVAIVRALERLRGVTHGLLVLDEPTPHLPRDGVERLFATVRNVAAAGTAVLFVTHRLDEVIELTDEVTVLRDGKIVARTATNEVSADELTRLLLGFTLAQLEGGEREETAKPVALAARAVTARQLREVSVELHIGEILGATGLLGMGWEELPYVLYGASDGAQGTIETGAATRPLTSWKPHDAIAHGIALVPADRLRDSVIVGASVRENLTAPWLRSFFTRGVLRLRRERNQALKLLRAFDVRPAETERPLGTLSGGNQQKVVLARWLEIEPSVLLLHEPTQGVDVGARTEIYRELRRRADQGTAILIATGEFEDMARLCDRVLIFRDGRIAGTLEGAALTFERIVEQAFMSDRQGSSS